MVTIFIYFRAGREIYKKHKQLRQVYYSSHHDPDPLPPMDDLWCSSKTTEVHVTSEVVNRDTIDLSVLGPRGSVAVAVVGSEQQVQVPNAAYSVTISASSRQQQRESLNDMTPPIPSTAAAARQNQNLPVTQPHRRRAAYEANNAAWSYAKCAILFFTAMLVTWIPSSANRVFSVVNAGMVSLPLEFMSAFVLPLQGFWNACIYIVTSWKACKTLGEDIFQFRVDRHRPSVDELVGIHGRIHGEGGQGGGTKTDGSDRHVHFSRMSDKDERGSSVGDGGGGNVRHPSESFSFASSGSAGEKSQV